MHEKEAKGGTLLDQECQVSRSRIRNVILADIEIDNPFGLSHCFDQIVENGVTDIVAFDFDTLKITFLLSNDVTKLPIEILGQSRITAYIQMSYC